MSKQLLLLGNLFLALAFLASCEDEDQNSPILLNSEITISNTLQTAADPAMGGTGGVETPIEAIFGLPTAALFASTKVDDGVEFKGYLDGLYDIDLSSEEITYNLVAPADHPVYANFFRTIEANTFDRYYIKFADRHYIKSAISNNTSVSLNILSDTEIIIEIGAGFSFNPGSTFTITLN